MCTKNLNKSIYIGTSISDLSKVLVQDFYYNYIKNKYGDKAEMLLTDTGSLIYKIETENVYEDLNIKSFLTSVIIRKIQNITIIQIT